MARYAFWNTDSEKYSLTAIFHEQQYVAVAKIINKKFNEARRKQWEDTVQPISDAEFTKSPTIALQIGVQYEVQLRFGSLELTEQVYNDVIVATFRERKHDAD